jgi:hypothetical protein
MPMRSAVSKFREHVCVDGCWICLAMEDEEDQKTVLSYLDDVRQEAWRHRMLEQAFWSKLGYDPSYSNLLV